MRSLPVSVEVDEGIRPAVRRLVRLELELAVAEARELLISAATALGAGIVGAVTLLAALVVLLAGVLAPRFGAPWEHLVIAGGVALVGAVAALGWSAWRLKQLRRPRLTRTSLEETWQWLEAQLTSRLRLH